MSGQWEIQAHAARAAKDSSTGEKNLVATVLIARWDANATDTLKSRTLFSCSIAAILQEK